MLLMDAKVETAETLGLQVVGILFFLRVSNKVFSGLCTSSSKTASLQNAEKAQDGTLLLPEGSFASWLFSPL
jgi:hypothetical protein